MSKKMICTHCGTVSTEFELAKYGSGCCPVRSYMGKEHYESHITLWAVNSVPINTMLNALPQIPTLKRIGLSAEIQELINKRITEFINQFKD